TDMEYLSNCIFADEAALHINVKRSYAWWRNSSRTMVKVPQIRALTNTLLDKNNALIHEYENILKHI
ncbi:hypothetical protein BX666DRAFT_1850106, partial [Dichotomocladium elegans]